MLATSWLTLLRLTPGRSAWALSQSLRLLADTRAADDAPERAARLDRIEAALTAALTLQRERVQVHSAYDRAKRSASQRQGDDDVTLRQSISAADTRLDRIWSAINSACDVATRAFDSDHPHHQHGVALRNALLPNGLRAVVQATYVEEHAHTSAALERLDASPPLQAAVVELGMTPYVDALRSHQAEFGALLEQLQRLQAAVSWGDVRDLDRRGHEATCRALARVIAECAEDEPVLGRTVLAVFRQQEDALRARRRAGRASVDVDPDSGEPEPEPAPVT